MSGRSWVQVPVGTQSIQNSILRNKERFRKKNEPCFVFHRIHSSFPSMNLHFVSFYSEDLISSKMIFESHIGKYVDTCRFYSGLELLNNPETAILVKPFPNPSPHNPGGSDWGYYRWKPHVILKTLEAAEDGDIVYYRDVNVLKYPGILANIEDTREIASFLLQETDFFMPVEHRLVSLRHCCKREALEHFGVFGDPKYMNAPLMNASAILCRKTEKAVQIVKEWLEYCMVDELIDTDTRKPQHGDFSHHTSDQSVLNIILRTHMYQQELFIPDYVMDNRAISLNMETLQSRSVP